MAYRLTKTWSDPHMQKLAGWTRDMMDASGPTAAGIGCSREAIVAQAALESNWGQTAIGHNLYGIKADPSWQCATRTVPTREVLGGRDVYMNAAFRDYPSYADSIADHFAFLKANSRYAAAGVFNAGSDRAYFEALQRAGYATDPNYASALMNMLASVKMFTACMVDDAAVLQVRPLPPPAGYVQIESGNVVRADMAQSTIVQSADSGRNVAVVAGAVGTAAPAVLAVAGMPWQTVLALAAFVLVGGLAYAAWVLIQIKARRLEMNREGIA